MSTSITTGRRFVLLAAAAALLFAMLPAAPAAADAQAVAVAGTAHLSGGFNNDPNVHAGCFSGTGAGTTSGAVSATFSYTNSQLEGTAAGNLDFPGTAHDVSFTWDRVGANAVLTLSNSTHSGNAVAAFAPVGPPSLSTPPCGPGPAAQVVGAGVLLPN